jgi:hypothetical protein
MGLKQVETLKTLLSNNKSFVKAITRLVRVPHLVGDYSATHPYASIKNHAAL